MKCGMRGCKGRSVQFRCIKIYCAFQQTSQSRVVLEWHLQKNDLLHRKKFLCIFTLVRVSVHGCSQRVLEYALLHAFVPEWVRVLAGMCVCSCMLVCKSANVWLCVCGWVNVSWGTGFNFLYSCARFKRLLFHEACTILPAHKVKSFKCLLSFFSISAKAASLATKTFGGFSLGRWNFEKVSCGKKGAMSHSVGLQQKMKKKQKTYWLHQTMMEVLDLP